MAFTSSAVWEVQPSGSDNNGGGFDPGVAGMATNLSVSNANAASPVASSATYNFVPGDVGNWLYIKSGTNSIPGWYKIVSVASNQATLDATIGHAVLAAGTPTTATGCGTASSLSSCTWAVDYSQATSAAFSFTDMVIDGTTNTKFTSVAHPAGDNLIGNIINVTSGTGFTVQRVAIVSRTTTTYNVDKSLGTLSSTGGNGALGGAFASLGAAGANNASGYTFWIRSGAYSITSASANVSNGCFSNSNGSQRIEGYGTVRGDLGTPPVLTAGNAISSFTVISKSSSGAIRNITIDCAGLTSSRAFLLGDGVYYLCFAKNCTSGGFSSSTNNAVAVMCSATGCSTVSPFNLGCCINCVAYSNTVSGFNALSAGLCNYVNCLSYNNSGASSDGFSNSTAQAGMSLKNCVAYGNGRDGFRSGGATTALVNCVAESNSGTGINLTGSFGQLVACGVYSNGTNIVNSGTYSFTISLVVYTASAFVTAASGNFALNANAGGGALLRAAGIPGVTPDGLSTGYLDIGAIQSPPLWPPARAFTWSN